MLFWRRELLAGSALLLLSGASSRAGLLLGELPWTPNAGNPPTPARPGPWQFFTEPEARAVEAIADRLIPPDPQTPGGKDSGCGVFIDRQLAGAYGSSQGHYVSPPFQKGTPQQGPQAAGGPAKIYRDGLTALDRYCRMNKRDQIFADLADNDKDEILTGLENGKVNLDDANGKDFFEQIFKDVQQGFFADPIYGGNRDMAAWKMIGFPGARYNYLDWIEHHNERYPHPPVSITGRAEWTVKKS